MLLTRLKILSLEKYLLAFKNSKNDENFESMKIHHEELPNRSTEKSLFRAGIATS